MKKLNSKGFTLVELLAVIIILAIVVGISIPAVLTTTNGAKVKAGKTAATEAANWVDRQYQVLVTGLDTAGVATIDSNFTDACGTSAFPASAGLKKCSSIDNTTVNENFLIAAGLSKGNVSSIDVSINGATGRSCVKLTIPDTSDYYWTGVEDKDKCANTGNGEACYLSITPKNGTTPGSAVIRAGVC